jgi:hypothetical protein
VLNFAIYGWIYYTQPEFDYSDNSREFNGWGISIKPFNRGYVKIFSPDDVYDVVSTNSTFFLENYNEYHELLWSSELQNLTTRFPKIIATSENFVVVSSHLTTDGSEYEYRSIDPEDSVKDIFGFLIFNKSGSLLKGIEYNRSSSIGFTSNSARWNGRLLSESGIILDNQLIVPETGILWSKDLSKIYNRISLIIINLESFEVTYLPVIDVTIFEIITATRLMKHKGSELDIFVETWNQIRQETVLQLFVFEYNTRAFKIENKVLFSTTCYHENACDVIPLHRNLYTAVKSDTNGNQFQFIYPGALFPWQSTTKYIRSNTKRVFLDTLHMLMLNNYQLVMGAFELATEGDYRGLDLGNGTGILVDYSIPLLSVITYYSNQLTEQKISIKRYLNTSSQSVTNIIRYDNNKFGVVVNVRLYDENTNFDTPLHVIHLFSQSPKYLQGRLLDYPGIEYLIPTVIASIIALFSYRRKMRFKPKIQDYPLSKEVEAEEFE